MKTWSSSEMWFPVYHSVTFTQTHDLFLCLHFPGAASSHVCGLLSEQTQVRAHRLWVHWDLLWGELPLIPQLILPELLKDFFYFSVSSLPGSQAAVGSQAAAQRPAHQTCSEDHEVSAAAEGLVVKHDSSACMALQHDATTHDDIIPIIWL